MPTGKTPKKEKASLLLCAQGLAETPEQAERLIMAGLVYMGHASGPMRVEKPGQPIPRGVPLEIRGRERFVSRGAYKLLTAIEYFGLDFSGQVALDAGASTGGFADCLLQHGAARVYAVDVGHGQLHEKLLRDPRVVNMERVNLRLAGPELLPEKVGVLTADLSFISLTAVLPACIPFLRPEAMVLALIKPQFELGFAKTERGVVKSEEARQAAIDKVLPAALSLGLELVGVVPSAIKGPKGNQEYMAYWRYKTTQHS